MTLTRLLAFILLSPGLASALVLLPDGVKPEVSYTEPTTYVDGTALKDLARICAYWTVDTTAQRTTCWAASGPAGGGVIAQMVFPDLVPILPGEHKQFSLKLTAGTASLESVPTPVVALDVNRSVVVSGPPSDPGSPVLGTPVLGATTATFPMTFAPSTDPSGGAVSYSYTAGYDTQVAQGVSDTPSLGLVMPYHVSGLAQGAWVCVMAVGPPPGLVPSVGSSCAPFTVPAKPIVTPPTFTLTTLKTGTGTGTVTGAGTFPGGTTAPVGQTADSGSTFTSWSGACTGSGTCSVFMDANKTVTATFTANAVTAPPAPNVTSTVNSCTVTLDVAPPDATSGWSARFKTDAGVTFGTVDAAAPFTRVKTTITPGTHTYYVEWLKNSVLVITSQKGTRACP
jgi:hypothetical protein